MRLKLDKSSHIMTHNCRIKRRMVLEGQDSWWTERTRKGMHYLHETSFLSSVLYECFNEWRAPVFYLCRRRTDTYVCVKIARQHKTRGKRGERITPKNKLSAINALNCEASDEVGSHSIHIISNILVVSVRARTYRVSKKRVMSSLSMNSRLLARFPTYMLASRLNVTTATSSKIDPPVIPAKKNRGYMRVGVVVLGIVGLYAFFKMSRNEEQLIEHSTDEKPVHSSPASSK